MANAALHRDKIVQATIRLYREKGYASTGLSEILKLSGAPKGSLYYYFPGGKEELTVEAIRVAGKVVEKTLLELASKSDSPHHFVQSYCDLLSGWMEGSGFKSGCPIATTALEAVPQSKAVTEVCQQVFATWSDIIARVFAKTGLVMSEAEEKAEQVIVMVEGALLLMRIQKSARSLRIVAKAFE